MVCIEEMPSSERFIKLSPPQQSLLMFSTFDTTTNDEENLPRTTTIAAGGTNNTSDDDDDIGGGVEIHDYKPTIVFFEGCSLRSDYVAISKIKQYRNFQNIHFNFKWISSPTIDDDKKKNNSSKYLANDDDGNANNLAAALHGTTIKDEYTAKDVFIVDHSPFERALHEYAHEYVKTRGIASKEYLTKVYFDTILPMQEILNVVFYFVINDKLQGIFWDGINDGMFYVNQLMYNRDDGGVNAAVTCLESNLVCTNMHRSLVNHLNEESDIQIEFS